MPVIVWEFVPDGRALVCCSMLASGLCVDKRNLKQMSVRGGTKLSGRNINLENVGKVLTMPGTEEKRMEQCL